MSGETPASQNPATSGSNNPAAPSLESILIQLSNQLRLHEEKLLSMDTTVGDMGLALRRLLNQPNTPAADTGSASLAPAPRPRTLPSTLKITLEKYSGAKGEDLVSWLMSADDFFRIQGIEDDATKMSTVGFYLIKNAKTWFNSLRHPSALEEDRITSWEQFKTRIQGHFLPINPVRRARDQLAALTQTGDVSDYTAQFRQITTQIPNITDEEKLDRYVRGLKPKTRKDVDMAEVTTFDQATKVAERAEAHLVRATQNAGTGSSRSDPTPMELNHVRAPPQGQGKKYKKLTPEEKQRRRDQNLCLYCGSDKHKVTECDVKKNQGKDNTRHRGA